MRDKQFPIIHTPRLCLRAMTDADAHKVMALLTDEEVGKTYLVPDFQSPEDVRRVFEALKRLSVSAEHFVYGIYLQQELIGFLNDVQIDGGQIELGFVIDPGRKNRGYATEALAAAMDALFRLGYGVVKTGAFAENAASIRVMEKCEMTRLPQVTPLTYRGITHNCVWFEKRQDL